jgi:hypothetical protein
MRSAPAYCTVTAAALRKMPFRGGKARLRVASDRRAGSHASGAFTGYLAARHGAAHGLLLPCVVNTGFPDRTMKEALR